MRTARRISQCSKGASPSLCKHTFAVQETGNETTYNLVVADFNLTPRGEVHVKGKSDPVATFQVAGLRTTTGPLRGLEGLHSALVGRDAEWQQLSTAMQRLRSGRGQIVSIIGEAGLGKSRLAAELRRVEVVIDPDGLEPRVDRRGVADDAERGELLASAQGK